MQLDLFDILYPTFKFDKTRPIRAVTTFSGLGFQEMGMDLAEIPYEMIGTSEIDKFAILSYAAIHTDYLKIRNVYNFPSKEIMLKHLQDRNIGIHLKTHKQTIHDSTNIEIIKDYYLASVLNKNLGDISKVNGQDIQKGIDLLTYSFPCVVGDTLVMTDDGYKEIVDVKVGDYVLTHDNTFKEVTKTFDNGVKEVLKIKGMGIDEIIATPDHEFYTREMFKVWNNKRRSYDRLFKEPKWTKAKDLNNKTYLGVAINQKSKLPQTELLKEYHENKYFWWVVGRFLADGWVKDDAGVMFGIGKHKQKEFDHFIKFLNIDYSVYEERTSNKVYIGNKEWNKFFKQFGHGASNKKITSMIFDLPKHYLESLIDGYMSGDGSFTQGVWKSSSVSKELTYGIAHCVAKVYETPYRIYKHDRKKPYKIEGRTGNQLPAYQLVYKKEKNKQDKAFYQDGFIWYPIQSVEEYGYENVYDLEVKENHSFTVNGTICHNCTDLSKAGQQAGLSCGTRSGLVYEVLRILYELKEQDNLPKVLIMENVIDLIQVKFIDEWNKIALEIEQLGYTNFTQELNGRDYGIAQNRRRVFMVSILGDHNYNFPQKMELEYKLKDYLEQVVDEKYYLSDNLIKTFNTDHPKHKRKHKFQKNQKPMEYDGYANTITTRETNVVDSTFIKVPEATKQGYALAKDGDGIYINRPHQKRGVVQDGMIQTIKANSNDIGVVVDGVQAAEQRTDEGLRYFKDNLMGTLRATDAGGDKRVVEIKNEPYCLNPKVEGKQPSLQDRIYDSDFVSTAITTSYHPYYTENRNNLKIRKLTPRETGRLMGMQDYQFDKQIKVTSDAQAYKQHGNGIVAQVIGMIIGMMWYEDENELNEVVERNSHTWLEKESK